MSDPLMKKRVNIWLMQQDCSLPWILRDKKIKNYADILALTPFEKRDDLESYFSKQENTELSK